MADIFKIQEAITFVQQTPPETFRLMDITIQVTPTAYEHGKVTVVAQATDILVAKNVNIFIMNAASGVTLKVGGTTNPAMTNMTHFSYYGAKTDFYISNSSTEDIAVTFASASI